MNIRKGLQKEHYENTDQNHRKHCGLRNTMVKIYHDPKQEVFYNVLELWRDPRQAKTRAEEFVLDDGPGWKVHQPGWIVRGMVRG